METAPDASESGYYAFLKLSGRPSILRAVIESVITFIFIVWLVQTLGVQPFGITP
jgi:hypothetical protein